MILKNILNEYGNVCFPDVVTAYMIFLTLPVTVASNERSLSKLKLPKTYLRAAHDRLSHLGFLSIERHRFSKINKCKVLEKFAQSKVRKGNISVMRKLRLIFQQANIPIDTCNSR